MNIRRGETSQRPDQFGGTADGQVNRPCVFIQTNEKQYLGAVVASYALKRNSAHPDLFDVRIMKQEEFPCFERYEGKSYLRHGRTQHWLNSDLQSFTPLRFAPPELMGYSGRALVIDPDVFAVGDVWELLNRDMGAKSILCRRSKVKGGAFASSVMLLDSAKLRHWSLEENLAEMFALKRDYMDWIMLRLERAETIGLIENEWNDFDRLTERTRMLHNTRRRTQPWRSGLPIDYTPTEDSSLKGRVMRLRRRLFGQYGLLGKYSRHPDHKQETLFFTLLRECLEAGLVTEQQLRSSMQENRLRHDALSLMGR